MYRSALFFMIALMPALASAAPHTLLAASISDSLQIGKTLALSGGAQYVLGIMLGRDVPSSVKKKDLHGVGFKGKEKSLFAIAKHLNNVGGNLQLVLLEIARNDDADAIRDLGVLNAALSDNLKLRQKLLADYVDHISQPLVAVGGSATALPTEWLDNETVLAHAYGEAFTQAIRMDNLRLAKTLADLGAYVYAEITAYAQSKEAIDYLSTVIELHEINSLYGAFSMPRHSEHLFVYYLSKLQPRDLALVLLKAAEDNSDRIFIEDLYQVFSEYHTDTITNGTAIPAEMLEETIDLALSRIMLAKKATGSSIRSLLADDMPDPSETMEQ